MGFYNLKNKNIKNLKLDGQLGYYKIAETNGNKVGTMVYVGRGDLGDRLRKHVSRFKSHCFKYKECSDDIDAYYGECKWYHDHGGDLGMLENKEHPKKPDDSDDTGIVCPECGE